MRKGCPGKRKVEGRDELTVWGNLILASVGLRPRPVFHSLIQQFLVLLLVTRSGQGAGATEVRQSRMLAGHTEKSFSVPGPVTGPCAGCHGDPE